jgi:hypothetical protein
MKQRRPHPSKRTKPVKKLKPTQEELGAMAKRAAQERASCRIGIDNEETRSPSAYRMNPDRGELWRQLAGNAYSRSR